MNDHWLIYAAGGGFGHCMRGLSLARAATKQNSSRSVTVIGNQTGIEKVARINSESRIATLGLNDKVSRSEFKMRVQKKLAGMHYSKLIVDTFPRGIVGELADHLENVGRPSVFVHRDITPEYITQEAVKSAVERFDRVLLPGEAAPFQDCASAKTTAPWLLLDPNELLSREDARAAMNCNDPELPACLVLLSGKENEREVFTEVASNLIDSIGDSCQVRLCGDVPSNQRKRLTNYSINIWPALRLMAGVDILVGAAGYNTFYEAQLSQTELFALPQARLYDRQHKRIKNCCSYSTTEELMAAIVNRVENWNKKSVDLNRINYVNGVHHAVREIDELG